MKIFKAFQKTLHLALLVVTTTLFAQTPQQLHYLDTYFEESLKEWQIPGMAIAIVNADSIVFSKGYGFANLLLSYVSLENRTRTIDKIRLKIIYSQYY